jgi:hypothetical protein
MHGAVGVLVAALGAVPASAATAAAAPSLLPTGKTYTVTLLSGDVVTVTGGKSGCPAVSVQPAAKSGVLNRSCGPDGHVRVVPARVAPLIDKVLDPALFDVTALILDGYDDAHTTDLPLIVRSGAASGRLAADPLTAGLTDTHTLPSISAVAGRRSKSTGAELIRSLTAAPATLRSSGSSSKIWLDRRVHATALDTNLTQISAPQAWRAGYTGTGSRIAVLDTGIDPTHPDLAGQIAETKDFTVDGGDAVDHFGHGTHVASTIAGTGAVSGGERKGVAPSAQLVIGKVLDDNGEGTDSQVIAGMQWAATQAPVINMSLGGYEASDGTDPLSLALDELSDSTGALFVVAAGNDGPADGTVSSPGAASRALTVGAVDGDDTLADFSSRGPLVNSHAAKPDLVAPGVDIAAARAAGTTMGPPIDQYYVTGSGTSMATPQVAGAAAVLAQRHPDWRAGQLKAALVGAADPIAGGDPYSSGAGRLNVARALRGVVAGPSTDSSLTWVNTGVTAATVTLGVSVSDHNGTAAPAGVATLSAGTLALAAGATGGVTLKLDQTPLASHPGLYSALVTAKAGGTVVARTPVVFFVEPPSYDLTIDTTTIPGAPDGASGWSSIQVVNLDDPAVFAAADGGDLGASLTFHVPAGRYSVLGSLMSWADDAQRAVLGGDPDITITGDTTVKIDASQARPFTATVAGVDTKAGALGLTYEQTARRGPAWGDFAYAWGDAAQVLAIPNDGAGIGTYHVYGGFSLDAANGDLYDLVHDYGNGIPPDPAYRVAAAEKAALARIDQHFYRVDAPDSVTGHKRYGLSPAGDFIAERSTDSVDGDRTDYVTPGYVWLDEAFWNGNVSQEGTRTYAPGSRQEKTWFRQPLHADWYDNPASPSYCRPAQPNRTSGNIHVELNSLIDEHDRFDCLAGQLPVSLSLERNGHLVGSSKSWFGNFSVPKQAANYRLTYDVDASQILPVSTHTSTSWTFRSAGPSGTASTPLPLLSIDYNLALGTFTIKQARGVRAQNVTAFSLSTSPDGGKTWQAVRADCAGAGIYRATLPKPGSGQKVSLKVTAKADRGSGIEQTIIDAIS